MTDATPSSDRAVFDELLAEDADRRMHYGALYYAQHGIPVFPINIITDAKGKTVKKPGIKSWPSEASTNPTIINSWWGSGGTHEGCLIGAVTGARSGWGVIDVDVKNGGKGLESLQKLADELMPIKSTAEFAFGQLLPHERLAPVGLVRTRSGGLHLWYPLGERSKTRGRNKVRGLPNLEFKATGHYVVVAPSDGYEWLKLIPMKDGWDTPVEEYLAGLPTIQEALLERMLDGLGDADDGSGADGDEIKIIIQGRGSELLKSAVKTLMSTPDGEGNDTVYKLCCDLYPYVALGEVTKVEVDQAVMAGIRNWGADEGTIKGTMGSAWKRTGERSIKFNTDLFPIITGIGTTVAIDVSESYENGNGNGTHQQNVETQPEVEEKQPEIIADESATVPNGAVAMAETSPNADVISTWIDIDLGPALDGSYVRPKTGILFRDDGIGLIYPGKEHSLYGETESGKSWIALIATAQTLIAGERVMYVDLESDMFEMVERLVALGVPEWAILDRLSYVNPEDGFIKNATNAAELSRKFEKPYALIVIDSMNEALGLDDMSSMSTDDVTKWMRLVPRQMAKASKAAVLIIDHVTKSGESRGRFAIGSQAKLSSVSGASFVVEPTSPLGRGLVGEITIRIAKDRPGTLRGIAAEWRAADRTQEIARIMVDATDPAKLIVSVKGPLADTERPTLQDSIIALVDEHPWEYTKRQIVEKIKGKDAETADAVRALLLIGDLVLDKRKRDEGDRQVMRELIGPAGSLIDEVVA